MQEREVGLLMRYVELSQLASVCCFVNEFSTRVLLSEVNNAYHGHGK